MGNKESMLFYYDWDDDFDEMTDEEVGKITRAIMKYEKTGQDTVFKDRAMKQLFRRMKKSVDENKERYQKRVESARNSANARWSNNANACDRIFENANDADSVTDSVTVTVTDNVTDTVTHSVCVTDAPDGAGDTHTRESVRAFFRDNGFKSDPDKFVDYNIGKGNEAIFDKPKRWQAVARNWEKNEKPPPATTSINRAESNYAEIEKRIFNQ